MIKQKGIKEYTNFFNIKPNPNEVINYTKTFCDIILFILDKYKAMGSKKDFFDGIIKLKEISLEEDMNSFINLQTRRNQAQKLLFLLESNKKTFGEKDYLEIRKFLKNIMLENFSRQILPKTSGIIKKHGHKTENYLNKNDMLKKKVLEPREYIGIDPEAYSDLDAPSIVTAMTPPKYTQPEHFHENNYEITFYTGKSLAKYKNGGETISLEANFGDFIIFPPNTIHTIHNPGNEPLINISVKLPSALLDRGSKIDNRPGKGEIRKSQKTSIDGVYKATFEKEGVPYYIKIFNFSEIENSEIILDSEGKKACFYIVKGDFIGNFLNEKKKNSLSQGDVILLDPKTKFNIQALNGEGVIYSVFLLN